MITLFSTLPMPLIRSLNLLLAILNCSFISLRLFFVKAYTKDISGGGLYIKTDKPLEIGEEFSLKLQIPDVEEALQIKCQVVWAREQTEDPKEKPTGMGVKFCEMTEKDTEILNNCLK